jgi:hypothetical protein
MMPITLTDEEASIALHWWNAVETLGGRGIPDERLKIKLQNSLPMPLPPRDSPVVVTPEAPSHAPKLSTVRRRHP